MGDFAGKIASLDSVSLARVIETAASLIPRERLALAKSRVSGGIRLLNTESELNDYLVAFGEIHRAKLMEFLPHLPYDEFAECGVAVIDWGCGQGLATAVLMDYLRTRNLTEKVRGIALIEIVPAALKRAEGIVKRYVAGMDVAVDAFPWNEENIERVFENLPGDVPVLHLFSNILDVRSLDIAGVRKAVERLRRGRMNYVLSCGPDMETKSSSPQQLLDFLQSFEKPRLFHAFPNGGSGRIYGDWKYWPYRYCKCYGFAYSLSPIAVEKPASEEPDVQDAPIASLPPPVFDHEDIFMYASVGMAEELESLVKAGCDVDLRNERGATALYFAAKYGNLECLDILIAAGADLELAIHTSGFTPYLIAVKYERREIIAALKSAECNVEVRDSRGRNAAEIVRAYNLGLKEDEL